MKLRGVYSIFFLSFLLSQTKCTPDSFKDKRSACEKIDSLNSSARKYLPTLPDSAFQIANRALHFSDDSDCIESRAESHQILSMVFFHQGVYKEAITHLHHAEEIHQSMNNQKHLAENANQLGLVYYNIKQPGLALESHRRALTLYKELKDSNGIAFSLGCIGHLFEKRKLYDTALVYQQKALTYYEKTEDQHGIATIFENLGSIYEDQENYPLALAYFTKAFVITEATRDSVAMIANVNNIGDTYRKTGQYSKAIEWTKEAVKLSVRLSDKYQLSSGYKDLSKIYNFTGDYENAYKNLEIGRNLYEDMYTQDATRQLALFQTLFEIERKNHAIEQLETNQKFNTTIKFTMALSFALIAMLAVVVISRQRSKIRKDKEVIQQNKQMHETQHKLMQAEIENTHLHEQGLQKELDTKVKALASHTLHIIGKNKILEDIQSKLSELLKEGPKDQRKPMKSLVKMIEQNFVQDKDWDDFRQIFEQVHQDFFHRLKQKAADLTRSDVRLASLIRLNMRSRDISIVLGISPDSLRISRYRLRKKLNLTQGESLTQFISSL